MTETHGITEVEWDVFIKGDTIEVMKTDKGPTGKPKIRRMKKDRIGIMFSQPK